MSTACVTVGPRPMPASASAQERLSFSEAALSTARGVSATFEVESTGLHQSKLSGSLDYAAPNAVQLTADGKFGDDAVHVELDSRGGDFVTRSSAKGPSASSHRDPVPPTLGDAFVVGLSRQGLLHNLARFVADKPVDRTDGTVREWLKAVDPKDGGPDAIVGEACHRVTYALEVALKKAGEMSVCISDATSLLLERKAKVRFDGGDMQVTERFRWTVR